MWLILAEYFHPAFPHTPLKVAYNIQWDFISKHISIGLCWKISTSGITNLNNKTGSYINKRNDPDCPRMSPTPLLTLCQLPGPLLEAMEIHWSKNVKGREESTP